MTGKKNRLLYQLKVTLRDIHPPIWRRIQVWEDTTLAQLHRILQIVMGWEDCHLHEFVIGGHTYSVPHPNDELNERTERKVRLREVVSGVGTMFEYEYDLGDDWHHDLLLEAVVEPEPRSLYPRCLAGEHSTPPEDIGGPPGYEDYLRAIADPAHEEHVDMLRWRGPFDPEAFSIDPVNQQLRKKFGEVKKMPAKPVSTQPRAPSRRVPEKALSALSFSTLLGMQAKEPKRIRLDDTVPVELNARERELVLEHTFAEEDLTDRLRVVPKPNQTPVYRFTLDDLDELVGYVAAEANHAKDKKLQKEWDRLYARLASVLESYTDEDD
jgi:Plasmid pRiA4b ORF-3-like protein